MTFVGIRAGTGGRPELTLRTSHLSPRTLRTTADGARIALVGTTALLLAGDHVALGVDVGAGCHLELVDTAGTVAYDGRGGASSWRVDITVADGASLTWKAEPFVVADGADVTRTTRVDLAATGVALLRETLVLGRSGERGGALRSRTRVAHGARPLLAEDLDLTDPVRRHRVGLLGAHRIVDTVSLFGRRPPADPPPGVRLFPLAGEGAVARHLGGDAHRSGAGALFQHWRAGVRPAIGDR
ncbi:urease accessory protein UreD [Nakamurella deserti]|uniref:urease accessory protein UreD n=1 Tax=Nakamurella deserti TaxID=2164074 RepID=UPI000DBE18C3|nr:urease accessory protein UreD [Nakamurella deserti]